MQNNLIALSEKHFKSVVDKNLADILAYYEDSEELTVFVEGPRWATYGFENVKKGWKDFVESAISLTDCNWTEKTASKQIGDLGFVAGIAELTVDVKGKISILKLRGTFVFEKQNEDWKVIHEHFSMPAEDPYGIGDWLKK